MEDKNEETKLTQFLHQNGYFCIMCNSKEQFQEQLALSLDMISLVIIDVYNYQADIFTTCLDIKRNSYSPFVVIIGNEPEENSQISALDAGADDFIHKPVKPQIFLRRIQALLFRKKVFKNFDPYISVNLHMDEQRHIAVKNKTQYFLPKKEFELLYLFYNKPDKIFSRQEISRVIWEEEKTTKYRIIDVLIRNLRKKLGNDIIRTRKGYGYGLNKKAV
jgi:two-component system alkaline phosphatase synthesis response regulator PhoP